MIHDFSSMPDGVDLQADVCIVGAGPAGIALARELSDTGLRIVVLESGGLHIESALQTLNHANTSELPLPGHLSGRARALGGSARLWAGQCLPLDAIDLEQRQWVAHSGWPISWQELQPYNRRAERFFRVSDEVYDARNYESFGVAAPAWSAEALRTHFTVYTPDVDTGKYHASALRRARDIQVVLHASAVDIVTDGEARKATGVRFRTLDGKTGIAKATSVVLCAGALENARLLLASNSVRSCGLGNDRDLVGRFLQDHPNGRTASLQDAGHGLQEMFRLFYRSGRRYFPKFALADSEQRSQHVLNANAHLVFDYPDDSPIATLQQIVRTSRIRKSPVVTGAQLKRLIAGLPDVGRALMQRARGHSASGAPSAVHLHCYLEQAPDADSRVTLDRSDCDALGMPKLRIQWRFGAQERRTLEVMTRVVTDEFARLNLGRFVAEPWLSQASDEWKTRLSDCNHPAGTTRLADDPSAGVVDRNGQVFGVENLYSCGSGMFPTSGYANPTLTIVAMAIRLGDHLQRRHRSELREELPALNLQRGNAH